MLGALYKMGDPELEEKLLDAWSLSIHIYYLFNLHRTK